MSQRGGCFTLIERTVVMGVVWVLAVRFGPRFEGTYRRALLTASARVLAAAIDLASRRAASFMYGTNLNIDGGTQMGTN